MISLILGFVSFYSQNERNGSDSDSVQHCLQGFPHVLHRHDAVPKILDVNQIDFDSEEWKDMRDILDDPHSPSARDSLLDEQVLGSLFKLGERN